jgi:hypothetical protein
MGASNKFPGTCVTFLKSTQSSICFTVPLAPVLDAMSWKGDAILLGLVALVEKGMSGWHIRTPAVLGAEQLPKGGALVAVWSFKPCEATMKG